MATFELSNREKQLLDFLRQLKSGEIKIRIENGQPVVIYEAINSRELDDTQLLKPRRATGSGLRNTNTGK